MSHTTLFTKSRFFVLLLSVLILSTFVFVATAQEELKEVKQLENTQEESAQADVPYNVSFTRKPLVTEVDGNRYTIEFTIQNDSGEDTVEVAYGAILELEQGAEESPQVIDTGEGGLVSLTPGGSEQVRFTYEAPTWLAGEYLLYAAMYESSGEQLDSGLIDEILFVGEEVLDVEILPNSCFFNYQSGSRAPFNIPRGIENNRLVSIECAVENFTGNKLTAIPQITIQKPALAGEVAYTHEETPVTLSPQNSTQISFEFPEIKSGGIYGIKLSLSGDFLSNQAFAEGFNYTAPQEASDSSHEAAQPEQQNAFVIIVTLLALVVLVAILTYKRKSKEPLPAIHNPEN